MFTCFNFGAARDPEMLHKIYNAEPVAPIMEIPRRAGGVFEISKYRSWTVYHFENMSFELWK